MEILISLIFAILVLAISNFKINNTGDIIFKNIYIILLLIGIFVPSYFTGIEAGQKQALKGKFDYKMEVIYELKDSVYTPVDITFTEIKH